LAHPHTLVETDRIGIPTQRYLLSPGFPSMAGRFLEERLPDTLPKSIGLHKEIAQKSCIAVNAHDCVAENVSITFRDDAMLASTS
jgi:hypothetical protein